MIFDFLVVFWYVISYNLPMIIDFHAHILPPKIRENRQKYCEDDPCFGLIYSDPKAKMATAEELIAGMDEAGVDISVVLNYGWTTHELCVETNDYILESITRYPKRLIGFCAVQPCSCEAAITEIERCVKGGVKGIGELRPDMQYFDLRDDIVMEPLIEAIRKHKLILSTHTSEPVGHDYPGKGTITPGVLYPFFTAFPDITVVCAHWGGGLPFYALMPEVKMATSNVYFDTAASPFLYSPEVYGQVAQLVGADKILFGTDYPLMKQSRVIKEINSQGLSEDTKEKILAGNAKRLLGI